jgi:hypothetical protein
MDKNKELCELLGLCWHEPIPDICCKCGSREPFNPDFSTDSGKIELLRLMPVEFVESLFSISEVEYHSYRPEKRMIVFAKFIDLITDTTGLLAQAAREWLTAQKGGIK